MWNKFKNLKYNTKLNIFYGISALLILFFIWDIVITTSAISSNQFYIQEQEINFNQFQNTFTYDYNLTIGGAIRTVAIDLIQIVFLVAFMLILYVHEVHNGRLK